MESHRFENGSADLIVNTFRRLKENEWIDQIVVTGIEFIKHNVLSDQTICT